MSKLTNYKDEELLMIVGEDIESELKARGYEYGWHKKTEYAGVIYIMVNPAFPHLIKIGYASNAENRCKDLSSETGVPTSYHVYATYRVKGKLKDLELHRLIKILDSTLQYDEHKEFYEMPPEKAYHILSAIAQINGDEKLLVYNPLKDSYIESAYQSPEGGKEVSELSDLKKQRLAFWICFNEVLKEKGYPFKEHKPDHSDWYTIAVGKSDRWLSMVLTQSKYEARVQLNIYDNKALFDYLYSQRNDIEKGFGAELQWDRQEGRKEDHVIYVIPGLDLNDESSYADEASQLIDVAVRMRDVFLKYMK